MQQICILAYYGMKICIYLEALVLKETSTLIQDTYTYTNAFGVLLYIHIRDNFRGPNACVHYREVPLYIRSCGFKVVSPGELSMLSKEEDESL